MLLEKGKKKSRFPRLRVICCVKGLALPPVSTYRSQLMVGMTSDDKKWQERPITVFLFLTSSGLVTYTDLMHKTYCVMVPDHDENDP